MFGRRDIRITVHPFRTLWTVGIALLAMYHWGLWAFVLVMLSNVHLTGLPPWKTFYVPW